jgi:heme-degrading monooxygenase HmoA
MAFAALAIHHPRPEHRQEWIEVMREAKRASEGAPGRLDMTNYADTKTGRLVGLSRWESLEALQAILPAAMAGASHYDELWGEQPSDVLVLEEV